MEYRKLSFSEHFEVEFMKSAVSPQIKVKDLRYQTTRTSEIIGINLSNFYRLMLLPEMIIRRFFQFHEPTLRLSYIGLSGGGNKASSPLKKEAKISQKELTRRPTLHLSELTRMPSRTPTIKEEEVEIELIDYQFNEIYSERPTKKTQNHHERNLRKAVKIAELISLSMASDSVDMSLIRKLAKISPYACSIPQAISEKLLINLNSNNFWALPQDRHKRSSIVTIIRRCLMAGIMKNPKRPLFDQDTINQYMKILNIVNDRLSICSDYPELCMEIEVTVIIRLISRAVDTIRWWSKVIHECRGIAQVVVGLKKGDPGPLLATILSYCNRIARVVKGSFIELMNDIEVLEEMIDISNVECKDQLQEYLAKRFEEISEMGWEQVHILLNYAVHSIENDKLDFSFIKEVVKFKELMNHKSWEIREGCATSLRELRGNENPEISKWAEKMTFKMIENENGRYDKCRGVANILMLAPIEPIELSIIGSREAISNIRGNETVIGRESEIAVIAFTLSCKNILTVVGKGGIGKTSIAIGYSQRYKNLYGIMHQINCETDESMKNGMVQLAQILGLQNNIQELLFDELIRELNAYQKLMLIILDKVGSNSEIHNIYVTNQNVKFLATRRSQQNEKTMLIRPLSTEDSKRILQEKISSSEEIEEFDELAELLEGWPLALVQSDFDGKFHHKAIY